MSYENSKACLLVATHCCCCNRPLVDAVSVEVGIGPVCRKKYGYDLDAPEEARTQANKLVCAIAASPGTYASAIKCTVLSTLGFGVLAERILTRMIDIRVEVDNNLQEYVVHAPYVADAGYFWKKYAGHYGVWDPKTKTRRFTRSPQTQRGIWKALTVMFPDRVGRSAKGVFRIGEVLPE